jgi:hypothetical protein
MESIITKLTKLTDIANDYKYTDNKYNSPTDIAILILTLLNFRKYLITQQL